MAVNYNYCDTHKKYFSTEDCELCILEREINEIKDEVIEQLTYLKQLLITYPDLTEQDINKLDNILKYLEQI